MSSYEVSTALVEDPGGGGGVVDALEELLAGAGGLGVGWNQGQPKQLGCKIRPVLSIWSIIMHKRTFGVQNCKENAVCCCVSDDSHSVP